MARVGPTNVVLVGGQRLINLFAAARGDKMALQPFAKLLVMSTCRYVIGNLARHEKCAVGILAETAPNVCEAW